MFDKRLLVLVASAKRYIANNVIFQWIALIANIILVLSIASVLESVLDQVAYGDLDPNAAWQWVGLIFIAAWCVVIRLCCTTAAQRNGAKASAEAKHVIRKAVYDKLVALGPSYTDHIATSEAVQISVEGVEQLESYFGAYLPQLFYAVLAPVTLFFCLAPFSLPAALVLLVCVPLIPMSIIAIQKIAKRVMGAYWDSYIDLGGTFLENLQGLTTLKIYQADEARHKVMNGHAESFRRATMNLLKMQLQSVTIMDFFAYGGAAVGIIVVLFQFLGGAASFSAAFSVIFLSADFFIPMRTLGSLFHTAMNGMSAADKMFDLLAVPEPARGSQVVDSESVDVRLEGVCHSYDGQRQVLSDVCMTVPAGSFAAIVGESGSGKSTLANVLAGYIGGYQGSVSIGGTDVRQIARESLMETLTVVSFNSYLFKGTVRENLLMARPSATDDQMWEALRQCRIDGFVAQGGGLDMPLTEQAANLSGGQRQRLAVARALLHETPIYLFDEATSNVDADSEAAIMAAIRHLAEDHTVIVISHRLATVASADCIHVMAEGRIVEQGSHDRLLAQDGAYARLWSQQQVLEAGEETQVEAPVIDERPVAEPAAQEAPRRKRGNLQVMRRMLGLVGPLAPWMALAVTLGVLGFTAATMLTVAGLYGLMGLLGMVPGFSLAVAIAAIAACGVLRGPLHYGEQICNHYLAFRILALVRDKVFGALRRLAPARLEGRDKGNLISVVTSDIELLEVFYAHTISPIIIAVLMAVIMVGFIASQSLCMALLALLAYACVGILVPLRASAAQGDRGMVMRTRLGDMNTFVLDSLRGLRETLQFGCERQRARDLVARMDALVGTELSMKRTTSFASAGTNIAILLFDVAGVCLAAGLFINGLIDFPQAVLSIGALMSSFGPFIAVANLGSTLQNTLACGERVLDLLDEQPETPDVVDGVDLQGFEGARLQQVGFTYGAGADAQQVLADVDLRIQPGEVVRITGPSGCGKSTLCKLLMRFWDATRGVVAINGTDIRCINTASLRSHEGYMTQTTHLFYGSIGDNIRLARPEASDEQVMEACRKAAIDGLIKRLPKGLDTPVGELGSSLSGGERQRIGLARMFLHDAPFVLLDEPTSNLDALSEAAVMRALEQGREGRTIVLISHRESTGRFADRSYSVANGRLS